MEVGGEVRAAAAAVKCAVAGVVGSKVKCGSGSSSRDKRIFRIAWRCVRRDGKRWRDSQIRSRVPGQRDRGKAVVDSAPVVRERRASVGERWRRVRFAVGGSSSESSEGK